MPEYWKRTAEATLFFYCHFLILFLPFFSYTITETHIQTRKLRAVSVFVSYPPFFNSIFRQTNTPFSQNRQYPTPFYLSVLYYHGNPWLLRESILLPDSTIFSPIAPLSAASKNPKIGAHHPPWWTPPSLKNLDFKPFFNTFACKYQKSYGIISELPPGRLLMIVSTIYLQKWPRGFTFLTTGFKLTRGCSFSLTTVFKCPWGRVQKWTPPLPTATDFQTTPKSNKRFPQHPMCRNPLFSAVSPIFCSCPLYQLSGLHFHILINYMESVFLCKLC